MHVRKQLETGSQKIVAEFQQLHQFLEEQERLLLAQLEELNKEIEKRRDEYVAKLSEELSSFSSLISEMEQKCQLPASEFLQDIKGTLSRCEREKFQNPVAFSSELKWRNWESSQRNASLETRMKEFTAAVNINLRLSFLLNSLFLEYSIPLSPSQAPCRIRVYLDYERGQVAFFDAGTGDPIVTFPPASFAGERIRPFFLCAVGSVRLL
ncbi:tripartite motif-containing protein 10-like [Mauremys mutica]|uniref:tripartite motif-containing protein 10-like n=1 Tax=Mauremys mutica TaxID=74926 RepID=UPI001D13A636|nr:tripartite motif-containing protein 10-like [Mauremys mutica]